MHAQCKNPVRLIRDDAVVVVIDLQEKILSVMSGAGETVRESVKLIKGFQALGCPVITTQQYTKGLGDAVSEIKEAAAAFGYIEKGCFTAMKEPDFTEALAKTGKRSVVLCGVEAHVCVLQTALDMLGAGYDVFLAIDAISSRKEIDKDTAIARMIQAGVVPVTVESVLFELLEDDSKSDTFKAISKLIK